MKNLTFTILSSFVVLFVFLIGVIFTMAATKVEASQPRKELVVYFSATGHTADVAKVLAKTLNASIVEIIPAEPYTGADLDWQAKSSRASKEHANPASRPAIREANLALAPFDTVYLGFPIWWGEAPRIILTYLETHDLSGKKVVLFATSGGSGFGNIASDLQKFLPKSKVIEGRVFPGFIAEAEIQNQVNDWLKTLTK